MELHLVTTIEAVAAYRDFNHSNYETQKNFYNTLYINAVIDLVLVVSSGATLVIMM